MLLQGIIWVQARDFCNCTWAWGRTELTFRSQQAPQTERIKMCSVYPGGLPAPWVSWERPDCFLATDFSRWLGGWEAKTTHTTADKTSEGRASQPCWRDIQGWRRSPRRGGNEGRGDTMEHRDICLFPKPMPLRPYASSTHLDIIQETTGDWSKILKFYPTLPEHLPKKTINMNQTNFNALRLVLFSLSSVV